MADRPALPVALRRFLATAVDTVEELEILMLAHGAGRAITAHEAAQLLHLAPAVAGRALEALSRRGLLDVRVASDILYRTAPVTPALVEGLEALARRYAADRTAVLQHVLWQRRVKGFASAFDLRRDDAE